MKINLPVLQCIIFLNLIMFTANAQNVKDAKNHIEQLCSTSFSGRGYTNDGHLKAANYIAEAWKKQGLNPFFKESFFQEFKVNANTFNGKFNLKINNVNLKAGEDFIVRPSSQGIKTKRKITFLDIGNFGSDKGISVLDKQLKTKNAIFYKNNKQNDVRLKVDALTNANNNDLIVEVSDKKLTWHISQYQNKSTYLMIKESALPKNPEKIKVNIENTYLQNISTKNVAAYIKGTEQPDSFFVFTGHYDHLGNMGKDKYIPGANDNASGIAMLLSLSEYYSSNPPKYSVLFIAFAAEELGLIGSEYFVKNESMDVTKIKFLINLDIVGGGSKGIQIVNSSIFKDAYQLMTEINDQNKYLPQIKIRGERKNSDHWYFYEKGVPSFFIYTLGGPPHYHDVFDIAETLPLTGFEGLHHLITDFIDKY